MIPTPLFLVHPALTGAVLPMVRRGQSVNASISFRSESARTRGVAASKSVVCASIGDRDAGAGHLRAAGRGLSPPPARAGDSARPRLSAAELADSLTGAGEAAGRLGGAGTEVDRIKLGFFSSAPP